MKRRKETNPTNSKWDWELMIENTSEKRKEHSEEDVI